MTFTEKSGETVMAGAAEVVEFQATLPVLIERASRALLEAKSSAELLEARDMARVAYDAAKSMARSNRAKQAHEDVMGAARRAQGDAALMMIRADMRFADEYDGAQERGEVASAGRPVIIPDGNNKATAAEIGVKPKNMHTARKLRDAEKADPGKAERVVKEIIERGEEPTHAKVVQEIAPSKAKEKPTPVDPERRKLFKLTPDAMVDEILALRADLADAKAKVKEQAAEIKALKDEVKGFEGDQADTIRRQAGIIRHKESEMYRANEKADKALAQAHALKKRVAELEKMGIAI